MYVDDTHLFLGISMKYAAASIKQLKISLKEERMRQIVLVDLSHLMQECHSCFHRVQTITMVYR